MPAPQLATLPAAHERPAPRVPGETLELGALRLHVRRLVNPTGEPMVFVHGLGGSSTNWTDLMTALAPVVDGHAIDLPGFGFSGPSPSGGYRPEDHAAAVLAYLDHALPGQAVHLVGNSMGGLVSTVLAAAHPERVRTLTLVSPALPDLRPVVMATRAPLLAASFFGPILLKPMQRGTPQERAQKLLGICYSDTRRIHQQRIDELIEDYKAQHEAGQTNAAFLASLRGIVSSTIVRAGADVWSKARTITAPVLWIHGKADKLVEWGLVRRAARTFPHLSTLIVDDSGHTTQMEHPELTARAILAHITKSGGAVAWLPNAQEKTA